MVPFVIVSGPTRGGRRRETGRCNTVDFSSRTVATGEDAFAVGRSSTFACHEAMKNEAIKPGNREKINGYGCCRPCWNPPGFPARDHRRGGGKRHRMV